MNILKRNLLRQITLKSELGKNVYRMQQQQQQIHSSHHVNGLFKLATTACIQTNNYTQIENKTNRNYSSETIKTNTGWLSSIVKFLQKNKATIKGKSALVYGEGIDAINHTEFVDRFQMENSFNSWFLITEIHVWMLMVRAMAEIEHGQAIRNEISGALWSDVVTRTKEIGQSRLVKKQINLLSQQFQYAIVAYDEGLTTDDKQLASALWTRFFDSNCDNYENIELLVKYIRYNIAKLDKLNSEDFLTRRQFTWPSLKDIESGKL